MSPRDIFGWLVGTLTPSEAGHFNHGLINLLACLARNWKAARAGQLKLVSFAEPPCMSGPSVEFWPQDLLLSKFHVFLSQPSQLRNLPQCQLQP